MKSDPIAGVQIRGAARRMATDDDIARMFGLSAEQLGAWRGVIDKERAAAMATLKWQRMKAQASTARRQDKS